VIIREVFPAREPGLRVSLTTSTTLAGIALGGSLAGAIYDWTGSYAAPLNQWHRLEYCEHGDRHLAVAADARARCASVEMMEHGSDSESAMAQG
jgi:hypothetical protein